jgi:uncharacterized paraquat-inducible protein A
MAAVCKQVPQKPEKEGWIFICPSCKAPVKMPLVNHIGKKTFCKNCGQALSWNDLS